MTKMILMIAVLAAGSVAFAQEKPALDPNAAAKHDNDDLTNDLTNGKAPEPDKADPGKMMKDFIDHTGAAAESLKQQQDPGAETQDHQRRATLAMDGLIEYVREQQKKQDTPPPPPPQPGEKKTKNPVPPQPGDPGDGPHQDGGRDAAKNSELPGGSVNPFNSNGELVTKDPKEWGNLPPKDRDLMLNSLQEGSLKSYQEKVRKYYESLAEIGRGNK